MKRALLCSLLLTGCTVGPDYVKPDVATAPAFQELGGKSPYSTPVAGEADLSRWWMQFGDAELQKLIAEALRSNLDLLTAASRVREAREQEIVAGAAGLPQVNASGNAIRLHSNSSLTSKLGGGSSSSGSSGSSGSAAPSGPMDVTLYSVGFDATWEVDIFGGVRRGVEAAAAGTDAARWQMRDGEVSLTAELATDYLTLRATQARIGLLRDEGASQQGVLKLTADRARAGFVTQLDVNQQTALVTSTRAQIPELQAQARAMEHAIAVLLAKQPEAMTAELDATAPMPALPASLPVGLPSDLLRRRPDVRAAERQLAQATAEVGVAVADLYPKFDLIGAVSLASNSLGTLAQSKNLSEVGLGSIMWPIFHGGEIHANIRSKEEERQQAYNAYQKAVLGAIRDAEDALARYTTEQQRLAELERSVTAARSSATLAARQYKAGTVTYVNVLTAQANLLSAEDQREQSRMTLATNLVSLYKALGGGWSEEPA
ncbi:MAG TPA: efflux transporter outer membrane subunit [Rhizomicrobium sp.]|jgi:NodT family efflux transporter outer membrane factor (OMF) lipoprotein